MLTVNQKPIYQTKTPSFGNLNGEIAKKSAKFVGKQAIGAATIASTVIIDLYGLVPVAPAEAIARGLSHLSKLTNKIGLTKKLDMSFVRAYAKAAGLKNQPTLMEIIKGQGVGIVNFYKELGLKKTAKFLGADILTPLKNLAQGILK